MPLTAFGLGFAAGVVVALVLVVAYCLGVAWWLCKEPEL